MSSPAALLKRIALVEMANLPEKEAYELFDQHYSQVRAFIQSIVKQEWIAEDLTQEVFIRAFNNFLTLKDNNRVKPWLFRIAKNRCMDYFRQGRNREKKCKLSIDSSLIPRSFQQERILEQQEMTKCVRNHFQLLPDNLRTVLWLFDVDGFTHKEIAEILDIDVSNVKVRLHRARKKMRIILNENCKFERDDRDVFVCIPSGECDQSDPTNKHSMVHEPSSSRK